MKKNILFRGFLISIFMLGISCDPFLEGTNENPNDPVSVSNTALLAPIELTLAYSYNANLARWSGLFTQHVKGVARQQSGFDGYNFTASNFSTDWSNLYVDVLQNLEVMIAQASEAGNNHYVGVGETLKAYTIMLMTDYWGSIPYSEAFGGVERLQPKFDSQASIYDEVHRLLSAARTSLSGSNGGISLSGDLVYGGDVALWIKATHAIDARAYIHQALLSDANYTAALNSVNQAFDSSEDDMTFKFGDAATTAAPWFQFNRDRGDTGFNSTFGDALDALSDPRRDLYDGDPDIDNFGDVYLTHEFFTIDQAVELITYRELQFIRAEALLATGGSQADIRAAYLGAIESSFSGLGLDAEYAAYIAQAEVSPATITLENVMTQKWFASYGDPESFSDWRRTAIPTLVPNNGVAIPTRWLYPQTEIELNANTPDATLYDNIDWDID